VIWNAPSGIKHFGNRCWLSEVGDCKLPDLHCWNCFYFRCKDVHMQVTCSVRAIQEVMKATILCNITIHERYCPLPAKCFNCIQNDNTSIKASSLSCNMWTSVIKFLMTGGKTPRIFNIQHLQGVSICLLPSNTFEHEVQMGKKVNCRWQPLKFWLRNLWHCAGYNNGTLSHQSCCFNSQADIVLHIIHKNCSHHI
jgi:hypothetical protein